MELYALVAVGLLLLVAAVLHGFARSHAGKQVAIGVVALAAIINATTAVFVG